MGTDAVCQRPCNPRRPHRNPRDPPIDGTVVTDVRRLRVVATVALIAAFALVAVPAPADSRVPSSFDRPEPDLFPAGGDRGCAPRDADDDHTSRSGGPFRRDPGSRFDPVRASSPLRAAPGSVRGRPDPAGGEGQVGEPLSVAQRPRDLLVRPGPLWQRDGLRSQADEEDGRCGPPHAAVRDARPVPQCQDRRRGHGQGDRPRALRVGSPVRPVPRPVRPAGPLLHRTDPVAVRPGSR